VQQRHGKTLDQTDKIRIVADGLMLSYTSIQVLKHPKSPALEDDSANMMLAAPLAGEKTPLGVPPPCVWERERERIMLEKNVRRRQG